MLVGRDVCKVNQRSYNERMREKWGESIFQRIFKTTQLVVNYDARVAETHKANAATLRKKLSLPDLDIDPTESVRLIFLFCH